MSGLLRAVTGIAVIKLFVLPAAALQAGETADKLPEPLTLEYALKLADEQTPELQRYQSDIDNAQADLRAAESLSGFKSSIEAQARWVEPADVVVGLGNEDHRYGITAKQNLYDFGRSSAAENAAQHRLAAGQLRYISARQRRRIEIMRRYFDVMLADLQFYRYNEEMAVAYIAMDRTRERRKLGQASDLEVLEKEVENQRIRHLRYQSQNEQRRARALLAQALNRPDQLSNTLTKPELPLLDRKLDEVENYQKQALDNNPLLKALQREVAAAEQSVTEARARYSPSLQGQAEAWSYTRELGSSDKWRAGVTLEIPLTTGGESDAQIARARARLYQARAALRERQFALQQAVLETWLDLENLRIKLDGMRANAQYRELYLDRSRALYEMEIKTDLGDAMVRVSEAERNLRETEYNIAVGWARLEALTGQMQLDPSVTPTPVSTPTQTQTSTPGASP
ncbi:MAG: TolC family protein [Gammaproteobacteria bacterium]|nr:TolC family protein [Gammaproteobacteria bacterium]MDH5650965.1 TolC family protein [Gammaproteobacteria bacterium]